MIQKKSSGCPPTARLCGIGSAAASAAATTHGQTPLFLCLQAKLCFHACNFIVNRNAAASAVLLFQSLCGVLRGRG